MQTTELCQLIPTMPNRSYCLSKPVKLSRLQAAGRFWLGAGGWRLWLVVMLGLGVVMEAGAGFWVNSGCGVDYVEWENSLGAFRDWENMGMLAALQDISKNTRFAALSRLTLRPTQNVAILKLIDGLSEGLDENVRDAAKAARQNLNKQTNQQFQNAKKPELLFEFSHFPLIKLIELLQSEHSSCILDEIINKLAQTDENNRHLIISKIAELLDGNYESKEDVSYLLGEIGEAAKAYAPKIAAHLSDEHIDTDPFRIALFHLDRLDDREVWMSLLASAYEVRDIRFQLRVDAYLLFGHDNEVRTATAWLGKRQLDELPDIGKLDQTAKIQAINALRIALHYPDRKEFHEVAKEAAENIASLVDSGDWKLDDVAWLVSVRQEVQHNQPRLTADVDKTIDSIQLVGSCVCCYGHWPAMPRFGPC